MEKKYQWLEVMRGLAAVWVLLSHTDLTTKAFHGDIGITFFARGSLGVDFFFILSGFIIAYSGSRMIENGRGIKEYVSARFFRIYLPYLPIGVGLFFAYQLFPDVSAGDRNIGLLTSVTLFPTQEATALSVAWTLKHELIFYALFSFMFLSRMLGIAVLSSWFAFVIVSFLTETQYASPFMDVLANPLNLWFMVGILISKTPCTSLKPRTWVLLFVGLALGLYSVTVLEFSRLYVGAVLGTMVYLMTKVNNINLKPPKSFLLLGAASYSIYLVHNPIQSIIARVPVNLGFELDTVSFFAVVAFGSLIAGIAYYFVIEFKAVRWSKAFIRKRHPRLLGSEKSKDVGQPSSA